jgi:hypothetical protein
VENANRKGAVGSCGRFCVKLTGENQAYR